MIAPTPYFSDRGCHVRIYEEAKALQSKGHAVKIVTYHNGRDLEPVAVERIANVPWYRKQEAGPSWHKPYLDLMLILKSWQVAKKFRPDVVHAHLHEGVCVGWPVAKLLGIPLVFDYQGSLSGECLNHGFFRKGGCLHRAFSTFELIINRTADYIITSSSAAAKELVADWGIAADKVKGFPDGVDTSFFKPAPKKLARVRMAEAIGRDLPEDRPIIIYLGLLNSYQGTDLLLDAALRLKSADVRFHLVVMGFPDEEYRAMSESMGLNDCVSFTGKIIYSDAPLLLSAGDLAVAPKLSLTEANGKLLNYMATGLPSVVFESDVNRELLGDSAVYVKTGEADLFAKAIESLLSDSERLSQYSKMTRERAIEIHSWDSRSELLGAVYSSLLKE